jgi:hypothetical protein
MVNGSWKSSRLFTLQSYGWLVALMISLVACSSDQAGSDIGEILEDASAHQDAFDGFDELGSTDAPDTVDVPDAVVTPGKARFIQISDLHVYGDAANPLTGPLQRAVGVLNGLAFDADFVSATGDYVDFLPDGLVPGDPSTFTAAVDTLKGLRWPVRTVAGNHEYYRSEQLDPTHDKAARDDYLLAALGHPMDETFDIRGVRFVQMNTMQGDLWQSNQGLVASFTDDQLAWLRTALDDGLPTVLLMHHPPTSGAETSTGDSLCRAIEDHPGVVKAFFAGHLHGFWKGSACGVPYYLVGNTNPDKPFYFEVEVDAATGAVTIVNEADIPFGEAPKFECDPEAALPIDPSGFAGTNQVIRVGSMTSNLPGLEGFEGDGLDKAPLVLRMDTWNGEIGELKTRLSQGVTTDGFVTYLDGAPCAGITFRVDGPCAISVETGLEFNLLPLLKALLKVTPDPSWVARLDITSLRLQGVVGVQGGVPSFEKGLLYLSASGTRALEDLKGILVSEYCGGRIPGCIAGEGGLPACPVGPTAGFFDQVPEECDVSLGSYSLRLVLGLVASYPLENVSITGAFFTESRADSVTPLPGSVDQAIFSTVDGGNCAPVL